MTWVLVWTVLVLAAAGVLFVLGRRLWRQGKALVSELGVATDRLEQVSDSLGGLSATPDRLDDGIDGVRSQGQRQRLRGDHVR